MFKTYIKSEKYPTSNALINNQTRALSLILKNLVINEKTLPLWLKKAANLDKNEYPVLGEQSPNKSKDDASPCLITFPWIK